jgi:hypothetical protein
MMISTLADNNLAVFPLEILSSQVLQAAFAVSFELILKIISNKTPQFI